MPITFEMRVPGITLPQIEASSALGSTYKNSPNDQNIIPNFSELGTQLYCVLTLVAFGLLARAFIKNQKKEFQERIAKKAHGGGSVHKTEGNKSKSHEGPRSKARALLAIAVVAISAIIARPLFEKPNNITTGPTPPSAHENPPTPPANNFVPITESTPKPIPNTPKPPPDIPTGDKIRRGATYPLVNPPDEVLQVLKRSAEIECRAKGTGPTTDYGHLMVIGINYEKVNDKDKYAFVNKQGKLIFSGTPNEARNNLDRRPYIICGQ